MILGCVGLTTLALLEAYTSLGKGEDKLQAQYHLPKMLRDKVVPTLVFSRFRIIYEHPRPIVLIFL